MSVLLALAVTHGAAPEPVRGQPFTGPMPEPAEPRDLPLSSTLYYAHEQAAALGKLNGPLAAELARRGVTLRDDRKVQVEIVGPRDGDAIRAETLAPFGGEVSNTWRNRADAWIPVDELVNLARGLPPGYVMEDAQRGQPGAVTGEGPAAIGTDAYLAAGFDGSGRTVAVIDAGYENLTAARDNGDAPAVSRSTRINYTPNGFEDDGTHGTGCVEAAFDHCPGATWRLYKIDSITDLGTAVDDAVEHGVDVISLSMGYFNTGWADDTGGPCEAAMTAAEAGMLFFTIAGNYAYKHWQGPYNDPDGDDIHNWADADEYLRMTLGDNRGGGFYLSWDTAGGTYDYDLYLYDQDQTTLLASSTSAGNVYESFVWTNTTGAARDYHLVVRRVSGGAAELELFYAGAGAGSFEYAHPQGSCTSPANTTHPNVIAVGAVAHSDFDAPSGTAGIIKSYSSQGPSRSGMMLPDLCGPTDTSGFTYAAFTGTSCATPNAAGATMALWSAFPTHDAGAVRDLIFAWAFERDWGEALADNVYGRGGVTLLPPVRATAWRSVRTHSGVGPLSIPLDAAATAGVSEPRLGGVQVVEVDFNQPVEVVGEIEAIDLAGDTAAYSPVATELIDGGRTLVIRFADPEGNDPGPLPDEACFSIDLADAIRSTNGSPVSGDTACVFRNLAGDTDGNGQVQLADAILACDRNLEPVDQANCRFDVDANGRMELADPILAFDRNLNRADCP